MICDFSHSIVLSMPFGEWNRDVLDPVAWSGGVDCYSVISRSGKVVGRIGGGRSSKISGPLCSKEPVSRGSGIAL